MAFKIYGKDRMLAKMRQIVKPLPDKVGIGLYRVGQRVMTRAKRITPVWNPDRPVPRGHTPGSLRASGQVHPPERNWRRVSVTLSFGNEIVDYAVYVHEDLEAHHATGQAKYLEQPLTEEAPNVARDVAEMIHLEHGEL